MSRPLVVAHRGASREAPENTMAAFELAWRQGADAIETDLRLSADGHLVAMHDPDGRRTLGDRRAISEMTLAEIKALDAGKRKHRRWAGERVPALPEILARLPAGRQLVLELKGDFLGELARDLADAPHDRITLIAFDPAAISGAKKRLPACRALLLFEDYASVPRKRRGDFLAARVRELGIDGVDLGYGLRLTADLLRPLREQERVAFVYTVNHAWGARRCARLGIHGITTDRPADARRWLGISA